MRLPITNLQQLHQWFEQHSGADHATFPFYSNPPNGFRDRDGDPIHQPLNVVWYDYVTGDFISVRYRGWTDQGHVVITRVEGSQQIDVITLQDDEGEILSILWERDL